MTRLLTALVVSLCLPATAHAFVITFKAPTQDNRGTCAVPNLVINLSDSVRVIGLYTGPIAGADSMKVGLGDLVAFVLPDRVGTFTERVFARDAGGYSCTTSVVYTVRDTLPPAAPTLSP